MKEMKSLSIKTGMILMVNWMRFVSLVLFLHQLGYHLVVFCFSSVPAFVFAASSISPLFADLAIICVNYSSY